MVTRSKGKTAVKLHLEWFNACLCASCLTLPGQGATFQCVNTPLFRKKKKIQVPSANKNGTDTKSLFTRHKQTQECFLCVYD